MNTVNFSEYGRLVFNDNYLSFCYTFSKNILLGLNAVICIVDQSFIKIKLDGYFLLCKDGVLLLDSNDDVKYSLFKKTINGICSNEGYILKVVDNKLVAVKTDFKSDCNTQIMYQPISKHLHYLSLYGITKINKEDFENLIKEIFKNKYTNTKFYYKKLIKGIKEPWNTSFNLCDTNSDWYISTIYPLVDITKENGVLQIIPSSHLLFNKEENEDDPYIFKSARCVEMKKGDIVVMISSLWYKWGKNKTDRDTTLLYTKFKGE